MGPLGLWCFWSLQLTWHSYDAPRLRSSMSILLQMIRGTFWFQDFPSKSYGSPATGRNVLKNRLIRETF